MKYLPEASLYAMAMGGLNQLFIYLINSIQQSNLFSIFTSNLLIFLTSLSTLISLSLPQQSTRKALYPMFTYYIGPSIHFPARMLHPILNSSDYAGCVQTIQISAIRTINYLTYSVLVITPAEVILQEAIRKI